MNNRQAMKSNDAKDRAMEVKNKKKRFDKYNALSPVPQSSVPNGAKIMTTTWTMKNKANGTLHGRLNILPEEVEVEASVDG